LLLLASPGRPPRAQAYKQNKEMLPKAAFQFGLKAGDGRKSSKDLTRKQDNKLSGQLRKIQARAVTLGRGCREACRWQPRESVPTEGKGEGAFFRLGEPGSSAAL